ncbi:uncharacterized protein N7482_001416 [Penicillium canariense]|uniref:Uncharacterized protein n=1 Tax=Penicillium canariense TaxID=189055 RepID=A0A9W9IDC7_9EURO|nr:uncharacterized protein N7482_001416 [Penicillium canariense]KAJ5175539.1 hypothetical protein N7482_001416 [Penicillium canariense]
MATHNLVNMGHPMPTTAKNGFNNSYTTDSSSSTLVSPTEGPSSAGTSFNSAGANTPPLQLETGSIEFLQSMTALLGPVPGVGLDQDQGSAYTSSATALFGSPARGDPQAPTPGPVDSQLLPFNINLAGTPFTGATPPETFSSTLVFHGDSAAPASPNWGIGLGPPVPVSESWNSFVPSASCVPFTQIPLGDPLRALEQGEVFNPQPEIVSAPDTVKERDRHDDDELFSLGSLPVETLPPTHVLFYFGVLSIMARLAPQFVFKKGGKDGQQVGARLLVYGHTILVPPISESVYLARVVACRRALIKIRKYNPQWLVPPLPRNRPTRPEWNWIRLLEAFCVEVGWPAPSYATSIMGNLWHGDLLVNGYFFRTFRQCESMAEAQNTVSHSAMYQLLVTENIDPGHVLPTESPLLTLQEVKGHVAAHPEDDCVHISQPFLEATEFVNSLPEGDIHRTPGRTSGVSEGKIVKQSVKSPQQQNQNQSPKASTKRAPPSLPPPKGIAPRRLGRGTRRKRSKPQPPPPPPKAKRKNMNKGKIIDFDRASQRPNANLVPLQNSRLTPVAITHEPEVDPLATLKAIQDGLGALSPQASYFRLMKTICAVLKISEPDIRCEPIPNHTLGSTHVVRAHFHDPSPYLTRASPVLLANVLGLGDEDAHSLGVKKVILFLLKMCTDEVGFGILDDTWASELGLLCNLEKEIGHRLRHGK